MLCFCTSIIFPSFFHKYNIISSKPNIASIPTNTNTVNPTSVITQSENINSLTNNLTITGNSSVNPFRYYTSEPAPMGIADFGINPNANESYAYNTTSFLGTAKIYSLSIGGGTSWGTVDLQLNVVLKLSVGSSTYAYWLQNVANIYTVNKHLSFLDCIFNFSSPGATLTPKGIRGSYFSPIGDYYEYWEPLSYNITYPDTIQMEIKSSLTKNGDPIIAFEYKNDNGSWIAYDNVTFLTATQSGSVNDMNLVVDGSQYTPNGLYYYDAEYVLCGHLNRETTVDQKNTKLDLQLEYYNGSNFQSIPHAYNFGSDTGETISNINVTPYNYTNGGNPYFELTYGSGSTLGPIIYTSNSLSLWMILGIIGVVVIGAIVFILTYFSLKHKKIEKFQNNR